MFTTTCVQTLMVREIVEKIEKVRNFKAIQEEASEEFDSFWN